MSNTDKTALMPKLRFPEFRGAEGWNEGQVADIAVSESSSRALNKLMLKSDGFPVYGADGFVGFIDSFDQADDYIAIVKDGSGVGRLTLKKGKSSTLSTLAYIKCKPGTNNLLTWLYFCLSSLDLRQFIKGSGIPHIYFSDYGNHRVLIPSPIEQQKIADCLSSLDELIAAQARKVDALKTHKKGLMQQLFPREGETQPRLRFPEFRDGGEWESKLLSDLVKSFKTGKLDANAMVDGGKYRFYTCAKNYYQIDHYAFDGEALLVAGNGAHLGYIHHYIGKFNAYQRTYVLQEFQTNVVFLRCLLDRYLPARIQFEKKDGNTPYIVLSTLTEMPLVIPSDPEEQQRIADCLTSLDTLITTATQELETLKTHKKGLMRQLFPSAEAVEA